MRLRMRWLLFASAMPLIRRFFFFFQITPRHARGACCRYADAASSRRQPRYIFFLR